MELFEKTLESETVFTGRVFTATVDRVTLPNGREGRREKIHHTGGVCVLALCGDGTVPMVRQFRYGLGRPLLELPAGKTEKGENPEGCGRRELAEECGLAAEAFIPLGTVVPTPAYCSEVIHIFLAKNLSSAAARLDSDEFLQVEHVPLERAFQMALDGDITDAKTVAALFRGYYYAKNHPDN